MDSWQILGIDKTQNRKEVKKAYAKALKNNNPETDPEGFMKIRGAYEEIIYFIDNIDNEINLQQDEEEFKEENLVKSYQDMLNEHNNENNQFYSKCLDKIAPLYNDYFKRIDVENWKSLINDLSLDEIRYLDLYGYMIFNEYCSLPKKVWEYLDSELELSLKAEFLWTNFIKFNYNLEYDIFSPENKLDYAAYVRYRFSAIISNHNYNYRNAIEFANCAIKIYKDDFVIYRILGMTYFKINDFDNSIKYFTLSLEKRANDFESLLYKGYSLYKKGDYKLALIDFEIVFNKNKENYLLNKLYAMSLIKLKKYSVIKKNIKYFDKDLKNDLDLDMIIYTNKNIPYNKDNITTKRYMYKPLMNKAKKIMRNTIVFIIFAVLFFEFTNLAKAVIPNEVAFIFLGLVWFLLVIDCFGGAENVK